MAVSINYTSDVAAFIDIDVVREDYQANVEKALKDARQRVELPGFRKGKAPMGMIEKKYGLGIKIDEINRLVGTRLYDFLEAEKLHVLGQPIPLAEIDVDFEKDENFKFAFEVALAPKLDVKLTKEDKLKYYNIEATDEMVQAHIEQMLNTAGHQEQVDTIEDRDLVKGRMAQVDGDLVKEDAIFLPAYMKNEAERAKFIGVAKNTVVEFSPYAAYEGNQAELASFLGIDKEEVENYKDTTFSFEVQSISRHIPAKLDEEFFKAAFGEEGEIKSEEALKDQIRAGFAEQFKAESDFKLVQDLRKFLLERVGKVNYAEDILKRWVVSQSQDRDMTDEQLDAEFPRMLEDLTVQLIKDQILEEHNVTVEEADLQALAVVVAKSQFAQYGMTSVPDEVLENYAKSLLEKKEMRQNIQARVLDSKLAEIVKNLVTLEVQTVSPEQFGDLISGEQA